MMPDGSLKHLHVVARALNDESGICRVRWRGDGRNRTKQAEETLRRSEGYLAEAQRLSHTGSWASKPASGENSVLVPRKLPSLALIRRVEYRQFETSFTSASIRMIKRKSGKPF